MLQFKSGQGLAIGLALGVCLWMLTGVFNEETPPEVTTKTSESLPEVQVRRVQAQPITRELVLSGHTEADKQVALTSELNAKVMSIAARQGEVIQAGSLILQLDPKDWPARLKEAQALEKQRELEYRSARDLRRKGLQNESQQVESLARLESARAQVIAAQHQVAASEIRAPFTGTFERKQVSVGDYVTQGAVMGQFVSIDPVVIEGAVPEANRHWLAKAKTAEVELVTGKTYPAEVRYLSTLANTETRTYPIEIIVTQPQASIPYGMTAKIRLKTSKVDAIFVTPSLLVLNKKGELGVKAVSQNQAVFVPATLIKAEQSGVWLDIRQPSIELIEVGAGFVEEGDPVRVKQSQITQHVSETSSLAEPQLAQEAAQP